MHIINKIFVLLLFFVPLSAITIKEKKANLCRNTSDLSPELDSALSKVNQDVRMRQRELREYYKIASDMYTEGYDEDEFEEIVCKIRDIREDIAMIESRWQEKATEEGRERYALWHQPQTNIEQLVIDYGSSDHVYLIPPDIGGIKVSLSSNLPIPRSCWSEMLELILSQNGIIVEEVSPFLRKLSTSKNLTAGLQMITKDRDDIVLLPEDQRICFVFSPPLIELKRVEQFLEKFINTETQSIHVVGKDLLIFSSVSELKKLLNLFDFMHTSSEATTYRLVTLSKMKNDEMAKMLSVLVGAEEEKGKGDENDLVEASGLKVLVLENMPRALFLVGTSKEIDQAEDIIKRIECQAGDVREKELFWYTCKYTNPDELADVLERVYNLMVCGYGCEIGGIDANIPPIPLPIDPTCLTRQCTPDARYSESFFQDGSVVINPAPVTLGNQCDRQRPGNQNRQNFIVDAKTGAIVMVVEKDILPKIKETIKRLDIPKKMVQIEVLLFEKRSSDRNQFSLNLLNIGSAASNCCSSGLIWNDIRRSFANKGILEFFISRPQTSYAPAFDVDYRFLLSQEDVQINSAPSVLTVNQTEAVISIVDEISINTGIYDVETINGTTLKDAFTRAQYGINLSITPTIHITDSSPYDDGIDYITLETEVGFDTIHPRPENKDRPDVTRRKITNEAVVADGQSVILGGLKRKTTQDCVDKIPFFGDIPLLGKLFSTNDYRDSSTEMFIMITPRIVKDPACELEWIKREEMKRRPGDLPEYLCRLSNAMDAERHRLFEGSLTLLFGPRQDRCYTPGWYNDAFCH